ncbi:MAG: CDP-glycerol--glycerophosphate glycerophosphotransferase [Clostridiales bacterium]|nr:MAG: CDP-glycerol--glycerophosphate glycerophosphotransferase [Clostridiales bacterium]
MKSKLEYILKHNRFVLKIYQIIFSYIFKFVGLFIKIDKRKIIFTSNSLRYNDSPKKIYEYLLKEYPDKFDFVWGVDQVFKYDISGKHREVKVDTLKYFLECLSAKYWVTSVNIERGLHFKPKKTVFLNTWHGVAINKMGNAVNSRNDFDWSKVNFIPYSNDSEIEIYESSFNARESSMIACGLPRNDELYNVNESLIGEIKHKLGLDVNKKIILYAPTWRDSDDFGSNYSIAPPINWKRWEEKLSDRYIVLLRTHPYTTKLMNVEFNDFVFNMSDYPLINDLLIISDVLISDYSSIFFDYCILERPIVCFGYDYELYKKIRGFYYDIDKEIPNGVMKTEEEVLYHINNIDYIKESAITKKFKDKHVKYGGNATKICVEHLIKGKYDEN